MNYYSVYQNRSMVYTNNTQKELTPDKAVSNNPYIITSHFAHEQYATMKSPEPIPHKIILNVSDMCNFQCKMCTFKPGNQNEKMRISDWKRLVSETYKANVWYTLFGGEPLLYEGIDDLIRHIGSLNAPMEIVTNGFYLDKHLDLIIKNNCKIIISVDGIGRIHDQIRNHNGSFKKIKEAIERIVRDYPEALNNQLCVNCVMLPENISVIGELIDYLANLGVKIVSFQHLQYYGETERSATDIMWREYYGDSFSVLLKPRCDFLYDQNTLNNLKTVSKTIERKRAQYPGMSICTLPVLTNEEIDVYYSDNHKRLLSKSSCLAPWTITSIAVDGTISLCLDANIGNYLSQGFWKVWYGDKARRFRDFVFGSPFAVCSRCCNYYNSYI